MIAIMLGLVIQLVQVRSCPTSAPSQPCAATAAMRCCEGKHTCPCAKESQPAQKPAPVVAAAVDLKWIGSKPAEPLRVGPVEFPTGNHALLPAALARAHAGYEGVPLSVAFCTFVI